MKINKLKLKNFSAVKNAMNANEIEIDFSCATNKICLLIGENGSGKTTILSQLHPFSDVGNLDVRNGNKLILENKDGYKEIEISKGNDIYVIKHFYTHQKEKNHSVKSYIFKNGNDLNVNGNVTSFKEIVKEELQIEPEYLKLIRLGSNVTSMIDLSATERKNFMSKIMDEIGVYLEYYKSINQKIRQLDELMSHAVDKIKRLDIQDEKIESDNIKYSKGILKSIEDEYISISSEILKLNDFIKEFGDLNEFYSNGNKLGNKFNKMNSIIERKNSIESDDVNFYNEKIKDLDLQINSLENELDANTIIIKNTVERLDTLHNQHRTFLIQLDKETNNDREIELMNENLKKTRLKLRELEGNLKNFKPSFTKSEFDKFYAFLINIQNILNRTYEFGKKPVSKVIELLESDTNVMNYINRHIIDLDEKKSDNTSLFMSTIMSRFMIGKENIEIPCKEDCQAKTLFYQIQNLIKNSDVDDDSEDMSFYHDMEFVYNNLKTVLPQFKEYEDIINKLPQDIKDDFLVANMYKKISKLYIIYNEKRMNEISSLVTEYDNYLQISSIYNDQEKNLSKFSNMSNTSYVKTQIDNVSSDIEDNEEQLKKLKNRNIEINEQIKELSKTLEFNQDVKETIEEFDIVKKEYNEYLKNKKDIHEALSKIKDLEIKSIDLNRDKEKLTIEIQNMISNLDQYRSLQKDYNKFSNLYDDLTILKNSLSSKTGIPLRIISNYLDNTNEITNDFLSIAYDGKIFIDNFNITANEFSIPFFNNGVRIDDVKYASQGELSFLSIALSFALSSQVLSKYNIMLLDEVDGPLDIKNREKFIKILETQIDKINSEQNFLITHNAMFSSYPVDILDLSFRNNEEDYPLANFIKINRK